MSQVEVKIKAKSTTMTAKYFLLSSGCVPNYNGIQELFPASREEGILNKQRHELS